MPTIKEIKAIHEAVSFSSMTKAESDLKMAISNFMKTMTKDGQKGAISAGIKSSLNSVLPPETVKIIKKIL